MIWQGSGGVCEAHPGTPVSCASDSPSLLTTGGKLPRGSRGWHRCDHYLLKYCILKENPKNKSTGRSRWVSIEDIVPLPATARFVLIVA